MMTRTRIVGAVLAIALAASCSLSALGASPLVEDALAGIGRLDQDVNGFSFIVAGDTRHWERFQQPETFRQIVREANALNAAFIIDVGDLLSTGYSEEPDTRRMWDGFIEVVHTARVPFFPVVGNHDVVNAMHEALWREYAGPTWYSFDYGGCHFIALNSDQAGYEGRISDEQFEWLRQDLENAGARHVFAFLHHPVFADPEVWGRVHELLRQYPTRAVFAGHAHIYRALPQADGIRYYITGGGGAEIGEHPLAGSFHHYLLVSVRGGEVFETVVRPGHVLPTDILSTGTPEQQAYLVNRLDYQQVPALADLVAAQLNNVVDPQLVEGLAAVAASGDVNGRPLALATIARLQQPRLLPGLLAVLDSDDRELFVTAATAIGRAGRPELADAVLPKLRPLLASDQEWVRLAALEIIGRVGGPRAIVMLDARLGDPSPAVRDGVLRALELAGAYAPPRANLVTLVPVIWRAAIDSDDQGEAAGWYADDLDDSGWVEAWTNLPWYEQQGALKGLRHSVAWGRVRFTVDERWRGRRIVMRVGGLDEGGTIYLNGHKLLERAAGEGDYEQPFEMEVTDKLRFGAPNLLAVRAFADTTLGGVWKPVSLYTVPR